MPTDDQEASADKHELRSGSPPWHINQAPFHRTPLPSETRCDVVVIGAGITGSLAAEALTRAGKSVIVVDKFMPGRGSTAASTAMLQWEIDTSLVELAGLYGAEKAANIYRRSQAAVTDLGSLVASLNVACAYTPRATLFLGAGEHGYGELSAEHDMRNRAGLPGALIERGPLVDTFAMDRPAAILSPGSAEADPLQLSLGLLRIALERGATLVEDEVVAYEWSDHAVHLTLAGGGAIEAAYAVLATGYAMPSFVTADIHKTVSSWCLATRVQPQENLWRDRVLLWEASDPYLYSRTTAEGRILIGGEDQETKDADERDALMPEKRARLIAKMSALWPRADYTLDTQWTAEFGETDDGLPLIGRVPGAKRFFAAYGYGGNGITFSYMASRMLMACLAGEERPWFDDFALDRPPVG
ncbi:NAD(P)/FAD-dependent oxidoreductase [Microvirga antarctica]|uniref:NAD(P)/FAD-dependent oxidoreductase n=1 Tax=Microvirga antarctica TaxID=2819233 RepID=UPI003CCED243